MQYKNNIVFLVFLCLSINSICGQETFFINDEIQWNTDGELGFKNGYTTNDPSQLPLYMVRIPLSNGGKVDARLVEFDFDDLEMDGGIYTRIMDHIKIHTTVEWERRKPYCKVSFIPIKRTGLQDYEKLNAFKIRINVIPDSNPISPYRDQTYTSNLSDGDIYKIATTDYSIHKITYDFLKNDLNIDIDNIDPKTIKIYGNGGGKLPGRNGDFRHDDVVENAIFISGENDGSFDSGDYILFYAEGANKKTFDVANSIFGMEPNVYDNKNYYFIKISPGNGLRLGNQASLDNANYTSSSFNDFTVLEEERYNLLKDYSGGSGSGSQWFGDKFDLVTEKDYQFNLPNIDNSTSIDCRVEMVARRGNNSSSKFSISANGQTFESSTMQFVNTTNVEATYARRGVISASVPPTGNLNMKITYDAPGGEAWLDFIQLNYRRNLVYNNSQFIFRDANSIGQGITEFQISNMNSNIVIWDISNPLSPKRQSYNTSGTQGSFGTTTDELKEFIAFDPSGNFSSPEAIGSIPNQNLHSITDVDALMIYHKDFEAAAQRLKEHRESHSGISIAMAEIDQVYNEFSSGSLDAVAIRDMAKMLYERTPRFKYLILFGDGSFDHKDTYEIGVNSRFIPVYETIQSLAPIEAFPTDDYYALLDNNEGAPMDGGTSELEGALDIAVGRIPVKTPFEAANAVDKIIRYDLAPETLGDWRNNLTFVADDEDNNTHINQADGIANFIDENYENFNINKIYLDAFRQISSSGGHTYPDAQKSINSSVFKGQLVINYLGHGGPNGWTQERTLLVEDINRWTNKYKMPLFITATCSFTGYDDPIAESAGELVFLNENGGGIGLFTTTRAVYSNANKRLTEETFNTIFEKVDGEYPPMGEILRLAKNGNSQDTITSNARKFTMIGDPTQHLALPEYGIMTTHINNQNVSGLDTLAALQEISISGIIVDNNGVQLNNFNGIVYPTIFDKKNIVSTLVNDPGESLPKDFTSQKNIIFKGSATVSNGAFTFSFIVPKDIDYQYGKGRISYYAHDGTSKDAAGYYDRIIIGGTAANPVSDDNPPLVEVFMDDEEFAFGGLTSPDPVIYVKLSDDFGINVASSGIGHDLTAVLDENTQNTITMNDFYEAETDNPKKGKAKYPLSNLETGLHTLRVKGWDIANNSGEGYTEFFVEDDAEVALEHVLNYPNPFTTNTEFQFEHNQAGKMLRVQVKIYSVSGKLVKTIDEDIFADGNRIRGIEWDGRDEYGDKIGRGVYLYKVSIANFNEDSINSTISSEFEKLVILN